MNLLKGAEKAVAGFVVAFIAALVAEVQAGTNLNVKALLLALGTAVVTSFSVYSVKNSQV